MDTCKQTIIKIFGGTGIVARICGVTAGAVSQWEEIPSKHQKTLWHEGQKLNLDISPEIFFGMPPKTKSKKSRSN